MGVLPFQVLNQDQGSGPSLNSTAAGLEWAQAVLNIATVPDFGEETSPGMGLLLAGCGKAQHCHCYSREGSSAQEQWFPIWCLFSSREYKFKKSINLKKKKKQGRWVSRSTQRVRAGFYQSGHTACWTHHQQLAQHPTAKPGPGPAPSWQQILGWVWAKKEADSWRDGARSEPIKIHWCATDSQCIQQVSQAWT